MKYVIQVEDTICAICSPIGVGSIAVIRVSGPDAFRIVKKIFKGEIITPGIRLKGDSAGDQKRIMRPKEAFQQGSTALVLGRSICEPVKNIKKNISRLIKELN